MQFVFRISGGIKCWDPDEDSDTGGPSSITVRMEYLLFNTDIVNFVWKTKEGEAESIVLLIFVLWRCLNLRWMRLVEWGRKTYLGPAEIASFSSRSFSTLNQVWFKCETLLLFCLIIFYYILRTTLFKIGIPQACNFIKELWYNKFP